ncbi:phosphate signaling complex protein PhoU [Mycobacterium hodleri]|uniref:phosphate signaling complex protein PhoU n=1 Tax=Mycolicibacterium hodleri TaxID=49897 RepID=UPI0021F26F6B|nr:phosphate signaling complex protein PhoU [Mycolicibacterium hodleri]MCV7132182.1 phosphate signaling complex protein PhoU [Mycolicibacterium hodleri]
MRTDFRQQLESLQDDLGAMCALAGDAVGNATRGLLDVDEDAAREVARDIGRLRFLHSTVEKRTLAILAKQAPVAGDLRRVVTAIHVAADADRMGGLASHVAKVGLRRHPRSAVPHELHGRFIEMGSTAVGLAECCRDILTTGDCAQAARVRSDDRVMETMHRELFGQVMSPGWEHGAVVASDVVLLGRFYGRFADHADEIARRMVFQTSGEALAREQAI